jgi:hypothetical protein
MPELGLTLTFAHTLTAADAVMCFSIGSQEPVFPFQTPVNQFGMTLPKYKATV